jgi:hypothetical protein
MGMQYARAQIPAPKTAGEVQKEKIRARSRSSRKKHSQRCRTSWHPVSDLYARCCLRRGTSTGGGSVDGIDKDGARIQTRGKCSASVSARAECDVSSYNRQAPGGTSMGDGLGDGANRIGCRRTIVWFGTIASLVRGSSACPKAQGWRQDNIEPWKQLACNAVSTGVT